MIDLTQKKYEVTLIVEEDCCGGLVTLVTEYQREFLGDVDEISLIKIIKKHHPRARVSAIKKEVAA